MNSAKELVTLPSTFKFSGKSYTKAVIHLNGSISFDEGSTISRFDGSIAPTSDGYTAFVSGFGLKAEDIYLTNDTSTEESEKRKGEIIYYNDIQKK